MNAHTGQIDTVRIGERRRLSISESLTTATLRIDLTLNFRGDFGATERIVLRGLTRHGGRCGLVVRTEVAYRSIGHRIGLTLGRVVGVTDGESAAHRLVLGLGRHHVGERFLTQIGCNVLAPDIPLQHPASIPRRVRDANLAPGFPGSSRPDTHAMGNQTGKFAGFSHP